MGRTTKVLADDLAAELKLPTRTARQFVKRLLEMVEDDLVTTGHVELRGLGTFALSMRPARKVKHPKTHKLVRIRVGRFVRFRSSVTLRRRLNPAGKRRRELPEESDLPPDAVGDEELGAEA